MICLCSNSAVGNCVQWMIPRNPTESTEMMTDLTMVTCHTDSKIVTTNDRWSNHQMKLSLNERFDADVMSANDRMLRNYHEKWRDYGHACLRVCGRPFAKTRALKGYTSKGYAWDQHLSNYACAESGKLCSEMSHEKRRSSIDWPIAHCPSWTHACGISAWVGC